MLYYIFPSTQLQVIEITATCFDYNQSSFRRAYEPLLVTICFCFCAFGIPDGLQFSYAYSVILIYYFRVLGCVCWFVPSEGGPSRWKNTGDYKHRQCVVSIDVTFRVGWVTLVAVEIQYASLILSVSL